MENGMTDEQADKIIAGIEALTKLIERVSRPPVVVTTDPGCAFVQNYVKRGYPVYFIPDESTEREKHQEEWRKLREAMSA